MALESVTFINDLVAANPPGTDGLAEGDNHIRNIKTALLGTLPGLAGRGFRAQTKSVNYTVSITDNTTLITCTATLTLSLTAVATLGNGFIFYVLNNSRGMITINPNASELIDGYLDYIVLPDRLVTVFSDGSAFFVVDTSELHANPIINSRMRFWGEGTATQSVSNGAQIHLATGMRLSIGNEIATGAGVCAAFRDTVVPSVLSSNVFPVFSTHFIVQTASSSSTHGSFIKFNIEGSNFIHIAQRPFVFSFWIRSSLTGNYNISISNGGADRSYAKSFQISSANTYEYKKFLIPASPSAGTWSYDENTGIVVRIMLAWAGSLITDDAWTSINGFASVANANWAGTLSASMNIAAPLMSLGYKPRIWTPDLPSVDVINTNRLHRKTFNPDVNPSGSAGAATGNAGALVTFATGNGNFRYVFDHTGMRAVPVYTLFNPTIVSNTWNGGTTKTAYTSTVINANLDRAWIEPDIIAGSASGNLITGHLEIDARL